VAAEGGGVAVHASPKQADLCAVMKDADLFNDGISSVARALSGMLSNPDCASPKAE